MLAAEAERCDVYHADAGADIPVVQKGVEASPETETAVSGETPICWFSLSITTEIR